MLQAVSNPHETSMLTLQKLHQGSDLKKKNRRFSVKSLGGTKLFLAHFQRTGLSLEIIRGHVASTLASRIYH